MRFTYRADWLELGVNGTLCDNDNGVSFSEFAMLNLLEVEGDPWTPTTHLGYDVAHACLPTRGRRVLRDQDVVGTGAETSHQRQPPTMPSHSDNDERSLMRSSCVVNFVHVLTNPRERGITAQR